MDQLMKEFIAIRTTVDIMKLRGKVSLMSFISRSIALVRMP